MKLSFVVHGPPVPKERARVVTRTDASGKSKTRGVTPARTAAYEKLVGMVAMGARSHVSAWPWQDKRARFGVSLRVYRSAERGDLDNFIKSATDACKGILWPDDSQVRRIDAVVEGCEKGRERIALDVWTLDD